MRALLAFLLLAIITPSAFAKCSDRFYVVSGSVVDASGAPISSALVGVSWMEQSSPSGPAMSLTDEKGHYSIPFIFVTYSGSSLLGGDKCNAVLNQISIAAYTSTQRSERAIVPIGKYPQVFAALIQIDRAIEREPLWPDENGG
jgi:hypothetical protein